MAFGRKQRGVQATEQAVDGYVQDTEFEEEPTAEDDADSGMDPELVIKLNGIADRLVSDYVAAKQNMVLKLRHNEITQEMFMNDVEQHLRNHYPDSRDYVTEILEIFYNAVFSYGVLTDLIDDPDVSDIKCLSYNNIRCKAKGKRLRAGVQFRDPQAYNTFVNLIATKNNVSISNLNAIQRFTDGITNPDFILRFTVSTPMVNTDPVPYLHIRKVPRAFPEIEDLIELEMMDRELAEMIVNRFCKGSTLICGGNSSGKTTILNALKEKLPEDMAVMVIQQAEELTSKAPREVMYLHSVPATGEGMVNYELDTIAITALTMDVDMVIIGEIKGAEAQHLLKAAYSGQLAAGTIHAPSADKGIDKAVDYSLTENSAYSKKELSKMLADSFDTVIFMKNFKVEQVCAILGFNDRTGVVEYDLIYDRSAGIRKAVN